MLVTHAKLPGRLYALIALRHLDRDAYRRYASMYAGSAEDVRTFSGCIISDTKAGEIVRGDHALEVRDGESGNEAFARQRNCGPFAIDIDHGGYSSLFFDPMPQLIEEEFRQAEHTYDLTPTVLDQLRRL